MMMGPEPMRRMDWRSVRLGMAFGHGVGAQSGDDAPDTFIGRVQRGATLFL